MNASGGASPTRGPSRQRYRFADLELDLGQRRLLRNGEQIRLPRLSYEFLRVLVEAAPNLVTHSELAARVWGPRRTVTPENLTQRLLMLRHGLGDDASHPHYIESIRSQGCRLIPAVSIVPADAAHDGGTGTRTEPLEPAFARSRVGVLAGIVGLLALIVIVPRIHEPPAAVTTDAVAASPGAAQARPGSIAVLRFEKLNAEPDKAAYFAEAMHAELINELGTSSDLGVIARASVLSYADVDLSMRTIANELHVPLIVTGTVRYSHDRVHVIAELLRPDTGMQLWSKAYDARPDDIFAVKHDIATEVARTLSARLPSASTSERVDMPTSSLEAFAFYMRAMDVFGSNTLGSRATAQTYLDQAIVLDEKFAHAYAGKALVETYSIINSNDAYEQSATSIAKKQQTVRDLAAKALALNPDTDLAFYALGMLDMFSWRWREAQRQFERAIELTPQHAVFLSQLGWLEVCGLGQLEGRRYVQRGVALDPQNPYVHQLYSNVLDCSGDGSAALEATEEALEVDATSFPNRMNRAFRTARVRGPEAALAELEKLEPLLTPARILSIPAVALAYRNLGRPQEARRLFDRFTAFADEHRTGPANWYLAYLSVGDYDNAYRMLEDAVERPGPGPGFYTLVSFMRNPGDSPPFNDPRFLDLRDRLRAKRQ